MQANIDDTTETITTQTIIIAVVVSGVVVLLLWMIVIYITSPLQSINRIANDIIQQSALEEHKRDYSTALNDSFFLKQRFDEIGVLTSEFLSVVMILHNQAVTKRQQPKYPPNPFYLRDIWKPEGPDTGINPAPVLQWDDFAVALSHIGIAPAAPEISSTEADFMKTAAVVELDVLASLTAPSGVANDLSAKGASQSVSQRFISFQG